MPFPNPLTISAPSSTDLWRKPPHHNATSAPIHVHTTLPLSRFHRVRASISGLWSQRYDQGGFVLHLTRPSHPGTQDKWLKAGVEFFGGRAMCSVVGTDRWSDWSVAAPVPSPIAKNEQQVEGEVTLEAIRQPDELGSGLWVYQIVCGEDGKEERVPLREVTWFFADEEQGGWEVSVGAYAARPAAEGGVLEVEIGGFVVEER